MGGKKTVIKDNIKLFGFLLIIVSSIVLNACGGGEGSLLPKQKLEIEIGKSELPVGEKTTYQAKLVKGDQEEEPVIVICTSSDETVAKVDADGITGLGAGTVIITCEFGTLSVSIKLNILPQSYPIQVTVSGLVFAATSLVLQNNEQDDLTIDKNGVFKFGAQIVNGDAYHVSVLQQPVDPDQLCTVENASGNVSNAAVTNIKVACTGVVDPRLPEAPKNLRITAATDKFTLHWDAVANAEQYLVYWAENITPDLTTVTPATVPDTPFILAGDLSESSTYHFIVVAQNLLGSGPMSAEISDKLIPISLAPLPPAPPSGLTVSSTEDAMTLEWEAVTNAEVYHIYRREDENTPVDSDRVTEANGVSGISYTDTNALQAGKVYQYWISAGNNAGFSTIARFPTTVQLKPVAPRWARVDSCDNTVYLSWQNIAGYHYVVKEGSEALSESGINEYTSGELTVGSTHTYHLEVTYLSGIDGGQVVAGAEEKTLIVSDALCTPLMITVPITKDSVKKNILIPMF